MNKELVGTFVQECKEEQELKAIFKRNHINFNNYFKYSGKIEEEKKVKEFKINKIESKKIVTNDPIVQFYFDNPGYTLEKRLNNYFKNLKNLKNGKSTKNE